MIFSKAIYRGIIDVSSLMRITDYGGRIRAYEKLCAHAVHEFKTNYNVLFPLMQSHPNMRFAGAYYYDAFLTTNDRGKPIPQLDATTKSPYITSFAPLAPLLYLVDKCT